MRAQRQAKAVTVQPYRQHCSAGRRRAGHGRSDQPCPLAAFRRRPAALQTSRGRRSRTLRPCSSPQPAPYGRLWAALHHRRNVPHRAAAALARNCHPTRPAKPHATQASLLSHPAARPCGLASQASSAPLPPHPLPRPPPPLPAVFNSHRRRPETRTAPLLPAFTATQWQARRCSWPAKASPAQRQRPAASWSVL